MSRLIVNSSFKYQCFILFFACMGFTFGLFYWSQIRPIYCPNQRHLSFYNHFQYRTRQTCRNENSQIFLTIAILSSYERLAHYLPILLETWFVTSTVDVEIVIFIEENSSMTEDFLQTIFEQINRSNIGSCIFIVKLKHVQNEYPPQKKSFYALKFLYSFYRSRTLWILRLDDNAYVHLPRLIPWLKSIDHHRPLYIGQGGTGRRNGPAIHFRHGQYFCMGGSGVVISQRTLNIVGPWLDRCYDNETRTRHEDVELGRCILKHVKINCTQAYDSKQFFYHHYGHSYQFEDFTPSVLSQAFVLHPVKNRSTFREIYAFHLRNYGKKIQSIPQRPSNEIDFTTFVGSVEFDLTRDVHYQRLSVRWKQYITTTLESYIDTLQRQWHQSRVNWTITNGQSILGYHRWIPRYRLELIMEILLNLRSISKPTNRSTIVRKRIHLQQRFLSQSALDFRDLTSRISTDIDQRLHLVVVANNKDEALKRLINNFEEQILSNLQDHDHFTLTILYHSNQTNLFDYLTQVSMKYTWNVHLIMLNQTSFTYNRGLGRQLVSTNFTDDQYLFFLDVDLIFTRQALINIRHFLLYHSSNSSCAVFFPIIYSNFSPQFITNTRPPAQLHSRNGLFSIYGFGNVALRKRDLNRVGGWETTNSDWGMEDVNLFQRFVNLRSTCFVFRAAEPGLRHSYHKKMCNTIRDQSRYKMCIDAETSLFGSQWDLTNDINNHQIIHNT